MRFFFDFVKEYGLFSLKEYRKFQRGQDGYVGQLCRSIREGFPVQRMGRLLNLCRAGSKRRYDWVQEKPDILGDYRCMKRDFPMRFGKELNPWKILVEFLQKH